MKTQKISSNTASWSLLFVRIGYTITDLTSPKTPLQHNFILKMNEYPIHVLGRRSTIFSFYQGVSLMMGLLLVGYGFLHVLIMKTNQLSAIPINILIFNTIICLISLILFMPYFFMVPFVFSGIAFLGFKISLLLILKK